jgi:hypothetical protein
VAYHGQDARATLKERAASIYGQYATQFKSRFDWLRPDLFVKSLGNDLESDANSLFQVLKKAGDWNPANDAKLDALCDLLTKKHSKEKVIVFSQFADTVRYLETQLQRRGIKMLSGVTGQDEDPTGYAWRFSPESNQKRDRIPPENELRVLLATDVLSEGQNLQDCAIVVNFDLPGAIIRLIQRAGRVDRIGQKSISLRWPTRFGRMQLTATRSFKRPFPNYPMLFTPQNQSQFEILRAAECSPTTPALPRLENHHALVRKGVEYVVAEEKTVGGQLGRPSGARFRTYERLKRHADLIKGTLFDTPQLAKTIEDIYRYPLRQSAIDTLNRQLRAGISDEKLAELAMALRDDDRLCIIHEEEQTQEPQIICSMGLWETNGV